MANTVQAFDTFEADRFNGVHNFSSHTFKVALLDGYSFTSSHVQLSEVISFETSGAGYTAGGAALQNLSVAFGGGFTTFDADDLLWQTATLTADAVYRFCESMDANARHLGMLLIQQNARLAIPEELFRLTESPDRTMQAFVVRQLWRLYRARGRTESWQPPPPDPKRALPNAPEGPTPRPEAAPAGADDVRGFLRRTLFGIPPARMPKDRPSGQQRPLPARRAKQALIEVVRDLALEDAGFARHVAPLFAEFIRSRGRSEQLACLVALTRIRRRWPALDAEEAA